MRFALGCTGAALILPPWGRAAAGLWATIAATAASLTIYTGLTVHYGLGVGDWIALAVVGLICAGYLLGASALLRRPGIALPGLLGGLFATLAGLAHVRVHRGRPGHLHPEIGWQQWVTVFAVPAVIGAAGTLWRRDPAAGRRVARLAALSAGLLQLLYATIAVAILGGGGPPDADGGFTVRGTVSDRLGNNIVDLVVGTLHHRDGRLGRRRPHRLPGTPPAHTGRPAGRRPGPGGVNTMTTPQPEPTNQHTPVTATPPSRTPHPADPRHRRPDRTRRQPPTPAAADLLVRQGEHQGTVFGDGHGVLVVRGTSVIAAAQRPAVRIDGEGTGTGHHPGLESEYESWA